MLGGGTLVLRERAMDAMVGAAAPRRTLRRGGTKGPVCPPPVGLCRVGELEPEEVEVVVDCGLFGIRGAGEPLSTFTALAAAAPAPAPAPATGDESTDTVPFTGVVEDEVAAALPPPLGLAWGLLFADAPGAEKKDLTVSIPPPPVDISSPPPC